MTDKTKIVLGILGAAAAGVVIGLLIAPEKGSEMRTRIRRTAGTWIDGLGNLRSKGGEALESVKDSVKDNMKKFKDAAKEKIQGARETTG